MTDFMEYIREAELSRVASDLKKENAALRTKCDDLTTGFKQALHLLQEMNFNEHYTGGFLEASYAMLEKYGQSDKGAE